MIVVCVLSVRGSWRSIPPEGTVHRPLWAGYGAPSRSGGWLGQRLSLTETVHRVGSTGLARSSLWGDAGHYAQPVAPVVHVRARTLLIPCQRFDQGSCYQIRGNRRGSGEIFPGVPRVGRGGARAPRVRRGGAPVPGVGRGGARVPGVGRSRGRIITLRMNLSWLY